MGQSGEFSEMFFRYRKHAPRVQHNRYVRGASYAGGGDLSGHLPLPAGTLGEEYDPVRSQYPPGSEYGPPDPGDELQPGPRTPELRFDPPIRPLPIEPDDPTRDLISIELAIERAKHGQSWEETAKPDPVLDDAWGRPPRDDPPDCQYIVEPQAGAEIVSHDMWNRPRMKEAPVCQYFLPSDETSAALETETGAALSRLSSDSEPPESSPNLDVHRDAYEAMDQAIDAMLDKQDSMQQADSLDELVQQLDPGSVMRQEMEPDPFQIMETTFDQAMQRMDPSNMMGPMG